MDVFNRQGDALIWARDHETLRIEPWGRDSLRVRATVAAAIRDDLPGALLEPGASQPIIEIGEAQAVIRNGGIEARLSADGKLAFFALGFGRRAPERSARPFRLAPGALLHPCCGRSLPPRSAFCGLRRRAALRPGPASARQAGSEGLRHRPGPAQHRGRHPVPAVQPGLRLPLEQPGRGARGAGCERDALGGRGDAAARLLDHRGADARRDPGALRRRDRPRADPARSGRRASGSASCAMPRRTSCLGSPVSTSAAVCPSPSSSPTISTGP